MRRIAAVLLLSAAVFAAPNAAEAQVAWDAPSLLRPGAPGGLSIFLADLAPSDGLGALVVYRRAPAPVGLGFRAGLVEAPGEDDIALLAGVDVSGTLADLEGAGDPRVVWWTGAGFGVGDDFLASFPLGLALGWRGSDEGVSFAPWVGAHLSLDARSGEGDGLDLAGIVDLGLDLTFQRDFMVRFGAALGDREALAIGVRLPTGS